nr:protein SSUH2 homolog [Pogona vitticeps]
MAQRSQALGIQTPYNYGSMNPIPAQGTYDFIPGAGMAQGPEPSAPPISGYEGTTFGDGGGKYFPPPPDLVPDRGGNAHPEHTDWSIPAITEDEAQEALVQYAASKCCYSSAPAKDMLFQDLHSFNTYRYRLETFTESRSSLWKTEPYTGEAVDSCLYSTPPLPWDMNVEVPEMFKDSVKRVRVPCTSSVKGCPVCACSGRRPCSTCHGCSREQCWVCNGKGFQFSDQRCSSCGGIGNIMCRTCSGMGTTACTNCKGKGQLLQYIELQVEWKNNVFEHVVDQRTGFPTELFKEVNGKKLFVDEQYMVYPVVDFPDNDINQASRNAVQQHQTRFASTARIVRQRQTIELIFLTKVEYEWRGKSHSYYVYGNEHRVHVEDYPATCCCTII